MLALHEIGRAHGHIVAQIVETELVVRTEGDVRVVSTTTSFTVRLVLVDAVYAQTVELIEGSHPFRVTFREIIVDRHDVYTATGKRTEENRAGSHKRLTFTGGHFGNLTLGKHDPTEKLHVVVHHFPFQVVTAGHPVVVIDGMHAVFVEFYEIFRHSEFAIVVRCRHLDRFVRRKTARRVLHDGKCLGQGFFQSHVHALEYLFLKFVDLREELFALFDGRFFDLGANLADLLIEIVGRALNIMLQLARFCTKFVVGQSLNRGRYGFDFFDPRLNQLHIAGGFAAKKFGEEFIEIHRMFFTRERGLRCSISSGECARGKVKVLAHARGGGKSPLKRAESAHIHWERVCATLSKPWAPNIRRTPAYRFAGGRSHIRRR